MNAHLQTVTTPDGLLSVRTREDAKIAAHFAKHPSFFESDVAIMRAFISAHDEVLDIGANIGSVTLPLARAAKRVHAFEPVSATADLLQHNIDQNNLTNVVVNRIGLSDHAGRLYIDSADDSGFASLAQEGHGETVPVSTLDMYAASLPVGFIKIDVEGMEAKVFAGGRQLIAKSRPVIFFELDKKSMQRVHVSLSRFYSVLPQYAFFFNLIEGQGGGFELGKLPWLGVLRFASSTVNVLAVPKEKTDFAYRGSATTLVMLAMRKLYNLLRRARN